MDVTLSALDRPHTLPMVGLREALSCNSGCTYSCRAHRSKAVSDTGDRLFVACMCVWLSHREQYLEVADVGVLGDQHLLHHSLPTALDTAALLGLVLPMARKAASAVSYCLSAARGLTLMHLMRSVTRCCAASIAAVLVLRLAPGGRRDTAGPTAGGGVVMLAEE